ncbi:hypothetical protein [Mesorhizobium sp. INR15]|uniref:hypothetical protein n=1 Tax=Mesorhizobium sp. INR15 TaxID=2654248 RepID=UPI00189646ED|nr:hypothetical protein [Mesorhizobium sp. INR15]QPC90762.1 hypothetical protein GA829_09300 [Mesorhizobium sp. INR15]
METPNVINAEKIRDKVTDALRSRFDNRLFNANSKRIHVSSPDNMTDFAVEIGIQADRRYEEYECYLTATIKWKKFSKLYKNFDIWYHKDKEEFRPKSNKIFCVASFDNIVDGFSAKGRAPFIVSSEEDIDAFIARCLDDLQGEVGVWIRRWFSWETAVDVLDVNKKICGAWRDIAYYCLLDQAYGREYACKWIAAIDSAGMPKLLGAQIDWIRLNLCA